MRIVDILHDGRVHLSCEIFPPKRFDGLRQVGDIAREIASAPPG
jgi:hypothetical protein